MKLRFYHPDRLLSNLFLPELVGLLSSFLGFEMSLLLFHRLLIYSPKPPFTSPCSTTQGFLGQVDSQGGLKSLGSLPQRLVRGVG